MQERRHGGIIEKYVIYVVSAATIGMLGWNAKSTEELKISVAGLAEKFALRTEVDRLRQETNAAIDAIRQDLAVMREKLDKVATEQARRTSLFPPRKDQ